MPDMLFRPKYHDLENNKKLFILHVAKIKAKPLSNFDLINCFVTGL